MRAFTYTNFVAGQASSDSIKSLAATPVHSPLAESKRRGRSTPRDQMLYVEPAASAYATTPGRGRGPSFINSHKDSPQPSPSAKPLANKTNKRAEPESTGRMTRSRSNTRLHTPEKPDWAVAPDDAAMNTPSRPITRSSSRNSLKASQSDLSVTNKRAGRRRTLASEASVDPETGIVEVNGKWARGTWKKSRGRA